MNNRIVTPRAATPYHLTLMCSGDPRTRPGQGYAFRDDALTSLDRLPYRTGTSAHTVVAPLPSSPGSSPLAPSSPVPTPQRSESRATMPSPRPPTDQFVGSFSIGTVGPPPSLTATFTLSRRRLQETFTVRPGSGVACRRALLISSLSTSPASHAVLS